MVGISLCLLRHVFCLADVREGLELLSRLIGIRGGFHGVCEKRSTQLEPKWQRAVSDKCLRTSNSAGDGDRMQKVASSVSMALEQMGEI